MKAAVQAKVARRDSKDSLFSLSELDWFSRNSYNLALQFCMTWTPPQTLRLVQACLKVLRRHIYNHGNLLIGSQLLDLYPSDIEVSIIEDLSLRRLFCEFLSASLLIVVARGEDIIEHEVLSLSRQMSLLKLKMSSCNIILVYAKPPADFVYRYMSSLTD